MPPLPKTQKRSGTKAKGAVRAKSGCYTCRIRRKKCDEQRDNFEGSCSTCVRLKLQCLGFGPKRPDWLRESRNVAELREKIKVFLASQGMIKGHSGSSSRNSEREHSILRLADDGSSSSGSSPPTPTLTIDDVRPTRGLTTSSIRDIPWNPDPYNSVQELSPDSPPYNSVDNGLGTDNMLFPSSLASSSSHSLPSSPSWPLQTTLQTYPSLALTSNFSNSYRQSITIEEDDPSMTMMTPMNRFLFPFEGPFNGSFGGLVDHYMSKVLKHQYLLADQPLFTRVMAESTHSSDAAYAAICLISSIHKFKSLNQGDNGDITRRYLDLKPLLTQKTYTLSDAMAALHVISSFLFIGGKGEWQNWLNVAYVFTDSVLRARWSAHKILMDCSEGMRYIIKTAMWFDVLASACTFQHPHFLPEYRELFKPPSAHINNLPAIPELKLSMQSIMGCENEVVWALAEITELLLWKERELIAGRLSVRELVDRGMKIEKHILPKPGPSLPPKHHDVHYHRYVTSDVFRASAFVYLHSVLSGDFPSCPEIMTGVDDTIRCLDRVSGMGRDDASQAVAARSVVRSVVFSIFICGCLTDNEVNRSTLRRHLEMQESEAVGNCHEIKKLMLEVWRDRESHRGGPVRWREMLKNSNILLV